MICSCTRVLVSNSADFRVWPGFILTSLNLYLPCLCPACTCYQPLSTVPAIQPTLVTHLLRITTSIGRLHRHLYITALSQPLSEHQWSPSWGCTGGLPLYVRLSWRVSCDTSAGFRWVGRFQRSLPRALGALMSLWFYWRFDNTVNVILELWPDSFPFLWRQLVKDQRNCYVALRKLAAVWLSWDAWKQHKDYTYRQYAY